MRDGAQRSSTCVDERSTAPLTPVLLRNGSAGGANEVARSVNREAGSQTSRLPLTWESQVEVGAMRGRASEVEQRWRESEVQDAGYRT